MAGAGCSLFAVRQQSDERCSLADFVYFIQCKTSSPRMVLPTFRVGLPGSINLFEIIPYSHIQRFVSMAILKPFKLTFMITISKCGELQDSSAGSVSSPCTVLFGAATGHTKYCVIGPLGLQDTYSHSIS